jgi:hypothetical protein
MCRSSARSRISAALAGFRPLAANHLSISRGRRPAPRRFPPQPGRGTSCCWVDSVAVPIVFKTYSSLPCRVLFAQQVASFLVWENPVNPSARGRIARWGGNGEGDSTILGSCLRLSARTRLCSRASRSGRRGCYVSLNPTEQSGHGQPESPSNDLERHERDVSLTTLQVRNVCSPQAQVVGQFDLSQCAPLAKGAQPHSEPRPNVRWHVAASCALPHRSRVHYWRSCSFGVRISRIKSEKKENNTI